MENITCKSCGGSVTRVGNYYVCDYCRNKWELDSGNDIHAVDRANAWSALRDGDFEKAGELFENLILKDGKNHEAYWGRALALGGIIYVTDMSENKKVPTCNNITEESFLHGKDVEKAISLAPETSRQPTRSRHRTSSASARNGSIRRQRSPLTTFSSASRTATESTESSVRRIALTRRISTTHSLPRATRSSSAVSASATRSPSSTSPTSTTQSRPPRS